jgi:sigma-B regulation protein RsbQ
LPVIEAFQRLNPLKKISYISIMESDILQRNNVRVVGKGTIPMLFAHGFGCGQDMWRFITPAFEKDYRLILFDYVGAGKSDQRFYNRQRYAHLQGYAMDILEICDALELKDVIFVGHSVSGMIGLLAAIARPDQFAQLIMIGPSPCYIDDDTYRGGFSHADITQLLDTMEKNYIGWANYLAPAIMGNYDQPGLGAELAASFCSTDPLIARQFAEATFFSDNRGDLASAATPTLLLQCTNDIIAPLEVGEFLAANMPNSTLRVMKATGHCPHMSAPEETIQLIQEYLTQQQNVLRN